MLRTDPAIRSNIAARRSPRTLGRLSLLLALALFATLVSPFIGVSNVFATPLDQKRAEARQIAAQIDANDNQISILDEQYNGAVLRIAQANRGIADARSRLRVAQRHADGLRTEVRARAAALYMGARAGTLFPQLDAKNAQDVASRSSYTAAAAARDSTLLSTLRSATAQLTARQRDLQGARQQAESESHRLANTRDLIAQANVRNHQLLAQVNGEIGALVIQEQRARQAAAEAAARAEFARKEALARQQQSGGFGNQQAPTNLPPPSGSAAIAVHAAEAQLNKPYRFAASGPDAFDCSGLTSYAWGQAGVSMAHFAATQYTEFPHVPIGQLAPGDLVFYGSPIHHVGMFVGNGTMIEAPHTGAFVRYSSIYRPDFVGASRP
ncbi:MAG TPA: C40 family peptidase [Acidimicrobiia bacterium]